jgi:hypothetical protein
MEPVLTLRSLGTNLLVSLSWSGLLVGEAQFMIMQMHIV